MTATASTTAPTAPSASARAYLSRIERADLARIALVGAGVLGVQRRAAPAGSAPGAAPVLDRQPRLPPVVNPQVVGPAHRQVRLAQRGPAHGHRVRLLGAHDLLGLGRLGDDADRYNHRTAAARRRRVRHGPPDLCGEGHLVAGPHRHLCGHVPPVEMCRTSTPAATSCGASSAVSSPVNPPSAQSVADSRMPRTVSPPTASRTAAAV